MPRYNYRCTNCDHYFEAQHGFNDPEPVCPLCASEVRKAIDSAPTFAQGALTHAGDGFRASKEQLRDKWREETPKLRKKMRDKLGDEAVNNIPTLNHDFDDD